MNTVVVGRHLNVKNLNSVLEQQENCHWYHYSQMSTHDVNSDKFDLDSLCDNESKTEFNLSD